jgi:hypothetical protein
MRQSAIPGIVPLGNARVKRSGIIISVVVIIIVVSVMPGSIGVSAVTITTVTVVIAACLPEVTVKLAMCTVEVTVVLAMHLPEVMTVLATVPLAFPVRIVGRNDGGEEEQSCQWDNSKERFLQHSLHNTLLSACFLLPIATQTPQKGFIERRVH